MIPRIKKLSGRNRGFTIIELLIVVIVIGVLAAAGIGKYQGFAENARAKTCISNSALIENGIAMWCTQNSSLSETGEGHSYFRRDGHTGNHQGTAAPYNGTFNIANTIRDTKAFYCPKVLANYQNVVNSIPNPWTGGFCWAIGYVFYYNGPNYGGTWNGASQHGWYDPAGAQVGHQIAFCASYGGYNCDNWDPNLRKFLHSSRWSQY